MNTKLIISTARIFSAIFRPYYMPIVGFVALFTFTYLNLLPWKFKLYILLIVYSFTIMLPRICVYVYRKINGWAPWHLRLRENRLVPYLVSIASYMACLYLMFNVHLPRYMCGIILSALLIQIFCASINIWWKISTHSAGAGGVTGALIGYSIIFMFNPIWWLCLTILISGIVGSSRMLLRQHSLSQVIAGFLVGVACGFAGIVFI